MQRVAALYVESGGVYACLDGVDPWDVGRDARRYGGPDPVVCHPPCERWGRYWYGQAGTPRGSPKRKRLGDDGGCFAAALAAVERFGGVIEHPEASHAWRFHGIAPPPRNGGWVRTRVGWTCCVEQGNYGHRARKATWLYYVGIRPPRELIWGKSLARTRLAAGFHTAAERRAALGTRKAARHPNTVEWLPKKLRARTPEPFRDLLLDLARGAV